jgi:dihydroorotate dehydrogenase (NAD+) catalytic subunit
MSVAGLDLTTQLGPVRLETPLVAASGTVGSVIEFVEVTDFRCYGAAVAKSVSDVEWTGRPAPRVAPSGVGMLNGIGIQNPGIDEWIAHAVPELGRVPTRVWGSAVGHTVEAFVEVASKMAGAGVPVIEINLSCPNLDGHLFALDPHRSADVVRAVREAVSVPIGAKLSPNSEDIVAVASACKEAGADWVVLTNTVWGAGIDLDTRRPKLSGTIGGYSGLPLKPIAMRCVIEVHRALPELPILGLGGVASGDDVVEYLLAGASAVGVGTAHFANPRVGAHIIGGLEKRMRTMGVTAVGELIGAMRPW